MALIVQGEQLPVALDALEDVSPPVLELHVRAEQQIADGSRYKDLARGRGGRRP
jgi:hypothetical protein